jgi:hypothetical protein
VTPASETIPVLPGHDPFALPGVPKLGGIPVAPALLAVPKLHRVPTLPEVSLIPGVPDIPLLPQPSVVQSMWQDVGDLGQRFAPINVAGMLESSPAHLAAFPTIKYLPKPFLDFINQLPIIGGRVPFNAFVLLPVPKKQLEPPTLPHAAIPGFLAIDTIIHSLLGDILWNSLPRVVRGPLQPVKAGTSHVLGMVSTLLRFWQVYWQPNIGDKSHSIQTLANKLKFLGYCCGTPF